jgi:hypothetical protein
MKSRKVSLGIRKVCIILEEQFGIGANPKSPPSVYLVQLALRIHSKGSASFPRDVNRFAIAKELQAHSSNQLTLVPLAAHNSIIGALPGKLTWHTRTARADKNSKSACRKPARRFQNAVSRAARGKSSDADSNDHVDTGCHLMFARIRNVCMRTNADHLC